jgi:tetratricopeptide (TPR) repeat protein
MAGSYECRVLYTGPHVNTVDFSPDGRRLASADSSGVRLWETASARPLGLVNLGYSEAAFFDARADHLLVSHYWSLYRWPVHEDQAGHRTTLRIGPPQNLKSQAHWIERSPDRGALATLLGEQVALFNGSSWTTKTVLGTHANGAHVAVSPNGEWVATSTYRRKGVKVWRAKDKKLICDWPDISETKFAFSPDGRWLVTGTAQEFTLWEVGTWDRRWNRVRAGDQNLPGLATFSPDGRVLAVAASLWLVQLLDTATGNVLATLTPPDPQLLRCLAFSPDGSRLAVGSETGVILLWDLRLLRDKLRAMGLEGNWPEYPPAASDVPPQPAQLQVAPGELSLFRQRPKGTPASFRQELQKLTEGLAREPDRVDLYECRGTRYVFLREHDRAAADYEKALELDPDRASTCRNLAWIYLVGPERLRRPERALALAQRAAHLLPDDYVIRNTLGLAYYRTGQWGAAVDTLQDAIAANSEGANAYDLFFLALRYSKLGQPDKARDHFARALRWISAQGDLAPLAVDRLDSFRREAAEVLGSALPEPEGRGRPGDSSCCNLHAAPGK